MVSQSLRADNKNRRLGVDCSSAPCGSPRISHIRYNHTQILMPRQSYEFKCSRSRIVTIHEPPKAIISKIALKLPSLTCINNAHVRRRHATKLRIQHLRISNRRKIVVQKIVHRMQWGHGREVKVLLW